MVVYGTLPNYSFMPTFGCLCYPYLRLYNKHKMSYYSSPCLFLGYPASYRGYRCIDLNTKKIFICKHVRFDEGVFPLAISSMQGSQCLLVMSWPWGLALVQVVPGLAMLRESKVRPVESQGVSIAPSTAAQPARPRWPKQVFQPKQRTHLMTLRSMSRELRDLVGVVTSSVDPTCYSQAVAHPEA